MQAFNGAYQEDSKISAKLVPYLQRGESYSIYSSGTHKTELALSLRYTPNQKSSSMTRLEHNSGTNSKFI